MLLIGILLKEKGHFVLAGLLYIGMVLMGFGYRLYPSYETTKL